MPRPRSGRPGTLSNRIAEVRRNAGFSQNTVAEKLQTHFTTISRHENTGQIPCSVILTYALLYRVPPVCLFFHPDEVHIAA